MAQHATVATDTIDESRAQRTLGAAKVRAYRRAQGLFAHQLGEQLGVSGQSVRFWERGIKLPRPKMQGELHDRGICEPNDWHLPAPADLAQDMAEEPAE